MNREQILSIFCELRSKREFEVIEAAYNRLRRYTFNRRFYKRETS